MSTTTSFAQVLNQRALVAILTEFGDRLGAELGDACSRDTFQLALAECLKQLPQQKAKTPKAKVAKGPSKMALKKASMLEELALLGGVAPEDDSIKSIRKAVSDRKKEIKVEEKAAKAEEKKAVKIAAAAEKKAAKKSTPKGKEYTARRLNDEDGEAILGENGSACRVRVHKETREVLKVKEDNWTTEAHSRFDVLFPEGKDVKKAKIVKKVNKKIKKKISKKPEKSAEEKVTIEQQALIAAMVSDVADEKLAQKTIAPVPTVAPVVEEQVVAEKSPVVAPAAVAEKQVVAEKSPVVVPAAAVEEEEEEEEELEELEEEELVEEELDEEETPEFPGEENIEEFEHDDLTKYDGVDFYVDEDANVWDENMAFVGKFNEEDDTLNMVEGYEPEEE